MIESLVDHFTSFETDTRVLPVIWHQCILVFAQRYKLDLEDTQRQRLKSLLKVHSHHLITSEVRRELFTGYSQIFADDDDQVSVHSRRSLVGGNKMAV